VSRSQAGFDRLAHWYRAAEFITFGTDLERARFEFLGHVAACRNILLLGEGDGRCAARVSAIAPNARILCVDSSPAMVERASARISGNAAAPRVRFLCADARSFNPGPGKFDAVATLFFLDCFGSDDLASLVTRVGSMLEPGAPWLFSDFVIPRRGIPRLRARAWLRVLYAFFSWETALKVSRLPPSEEILAQAGWSRVACRDRQWGMLRSAVFQRRAVGAAGPP
jgi:ubiquinone/menaquinone biosynthesis C-methylase UbiE